MRVAIFEPEPRVCGPVNWAWHARAGFRAAGDDADVVSFTKSGKTRKAWRSKRAEARVDDWTDQTYKGWTQWGAAPDVVGRWADAGDVLDGYDLVVLTEPRHLTEDRNAAREGREPWYLAALGATRTPWTTALHGPQYHEGLAPHLAEVFDRGNFAGVVTTPNPAFATSGAWAGLDYVPRVVHPLPYAPRHQVGAALPPIGAVGMTGRAVPNKGHHILAHAAGELVPPWGVELWGAASLGSGPNFAYTVFEGLLADGWEGERNGKREVIGADGELVGAESGATRPASGVLAPYKWWAERGPHWVEYRGGYEDAVGVCGRLAVHVDLTSAAFSHGLLEFVVLEAMDAGSMPVVPPHIGPYRYPDDYVLFTIPGFDAPAGMAAVRDGLPDARAQVERVAKVAMSAAETAETFAARRDVAAANRTALRRHHDPASFAAQLREAVV